MEKQKKNPRCHTSIHSPLYLCGVRDCVPLRSCYRPHTITITTTTATTTTTTTHTFSCVDLRRPPAYTIICYINCSQNLKTLRRQRKLLSQRVLVLLRVTIDTAEAVSSVQAYPRCVKICVLFIEGGTKYILAFNSFHFSCGIYIYFIFTNITF